MSAEVIVLEDDDDDDCGSTSFSEKNRLFLIDAMRWKYLYQVIARLQEDYGDNADTLTPQQILALVLGHIPNRMTIKPTVTTRKQRVQKTTIDVEAASDTPPEGPAPPSLSIPDDDVDAASSDAGVQTDYVDHRERYQFRVLQTFIRPDLPPPSAGVVTISEDMPAGETFEGEAALRSLAGLPDEPGLGERDFPFCTALAPSGSALVTSLTNWGSPLMLWSAIDCCVCRRKIGKRGVGRVAQCGHLLCQRCLDQPHLMTCCLCAKKFSAESTHPIYL